MFSTYYHKAPQLFAQAQSNLDSILRLYLNDLTAVEHVLEERLFTLTFELAFFGFDHEKPKTDTHFSGFTDKLQQLANITGFLGRRASSTQC